MHEQEMLLINNIRAYTPALPQIIFMFSYNTPMETKTAFGGTKRRKYESSSSSGMSRVSYANKRISKLYKIVKAHNPSHLQVVSLAAAFPTISTTGTLYDLGTNIAQGDAPSDRFSSQCIFKRLFLKGGLFPGTTANSSALVRCTIFRGQAGLAFAANLTSSYNPVWYSSSTMVIYDRFFQVAPATATQGYPTVWNKSFNLKNHKQKFTSSAAATTTGESLYVLIQSSATAGTTAPSILGSMEIYFDPT